MVSIRPVTAADVSFLQQMLYAAALWRNDVAKPPMEWAMAHPQLAMFHEGWGRPGDAGFVAERDGRPVGAVWCRRFTKDSHGEGFLDEETPELVIAVADGERGRGVGRQLMHALHAHAGELGVSRFSLSVDADNPARKLYSQLGYRDAVTDEYDDRMVIDL